MTETIKDIAEMIEPIGKVEDINQLKNVIRFILKNIPQDKTKYKTEIIKLCFILDYKYKKEKNKPCPTTVSYVRYNYGPYSDHFIEAFGQLVKEGVIVEVTLPFGIGYNSSIDEEIILDEDIKNFILNILREYSNSTLRQMKEYIYELPEFKQAQFGQEILI